MCLIYITSQLVLHINLILETKAVRSRVSRWGATEFLDPLMIGILFPIAWGINYSKLKQ